jgi:hypothetical protein
MQDKPQDQYACNRQREWMTRRRAACGLLLGSAGLACLAGWLWVANSRRVTWVRLEKVRTGMSRQQVIRTVGGPPGDYSNGRERALSGHGRCEDWLCDDGELLVYFDDADVVIGAASTRPSPRHASNPGPPSLTERVRRWLGL